MNSIAIGGGDNRWSGNRAPRGTILQSGSGMSTQGPAATGSPVVRPAPSKGGGIIIN